MSEFRNINTVIAYAKAIVRNMDEKYPQLESLIEQAEMDASHFSTELAKLQTDYTAAIKANAEMAHVNADLQEKLNALQQAIEQAWEAIDLALNWGPKTQSDEYLIESRLKDALAALEGVKWSS